MKKILFAMFAMALLVTSCSDSSDEIENVAQDVAAKYEGYANAGCAYFSNSITDNQTVVVTAKTTNTADVTYTSDTWGTFTISDATVAKSGATYYITGSGTTLMGHAGATPKEYDCTLSGIVANGNGEFTFTCPSVMGGLTIKIQQGDVPAELVVPGTYSGYTKADCAYFKDNYSDDESATITFENNAYTLTYESATWGTFTIENISVTNENGTFVLSGSGKTLMGHAGATAKEYDCTFTGSVDVAKSNYKLSFSVPSVMGGLTIELNPGTAPTTEN
jgi:hypothetical protein